MGIPTVTKCCCFELRTGCLILGCISIIVGISGIPVCIYEIAEYGNNTSPEKMFPKHIILILIISMLSIVGATLLLLGVNKAKPKYILAFVVTESIVLVIDVAKIIVLTIAGYTLALLFIFGIVLGLYFILVVYSYYEVVKKGTTNNGIIYHQPSRSPRNIA